MFFEKLIKWVSSEASHRSGVLTNPTALVFDPRHKVEIPPIISFERWAHQQDVPSRAVAFLQMYADATNVMIVDIEKRQLVSRIDVPNKYLGEFTQIFLTVDKAQLRSILQAPRWMVAPLRKRISAAVSMTASAEMATAAGSGEMRVQGGVIGGYPPDASTDGVRPGGDRPPDPPRVQALVTLAEETAALQVLPVVGAAPLEN